MKIDPIIEKYSVKHLTKITPAIRPSVKLTEEEKLVLMRRIRERSRKVRR